LSILTSEHIENNRISINCQDYAFTGGGYVSSIYGFSKLKE